VLNIADVGHALVLASLLASVDGACIVESDGQVASIESHLAATDTANELLLPEHGTRHTSAKRFSFDAPETVAIVVSQDGPVTVFSDGMSVLRLEEVGSYRSAIVSRNPAKADAIHSEYGESVCTRCGKRFLVETTRFEGWDDLEIVSCPVCCHPGLVEARAVHVNVMPVKPWIDGDASSGS
jgi:hypothetical protein